MNAIRFPNLTQLTTLTLDQNVLIVLIGREIARIRYTQNDDVPNNPCRVSPKNNRSL